MLTLMLIILLCYVNVNNNVNAFVCLQCYLCYGCYYIVERMLQEVFFLGTVVQSHYFAWREKKKNK